MNYWNNSGLASYIASGQLKIHFNPQGEEKAGKEVSDSRMDLKSSLYSMDAAFERRIELIDISLQEHE